MKHWLQARCWALLVAILCWSSPLLAGSVVSLADDQAGTVLDGNLDIFYDAKGSMPIGRVAREAGFRIAQPGDFRSRYLREAIWLRFTLHNPDHEARQRLVEVGAPRLQDVRLFWQARDGDWLVQQAGSMVPVRQRVVPARQNVFPVVLAAGETRTVYVRVRSDNAMVLHLRLWESSGFLASEQRINVLNSMQFGALLLFALYAFFFFVLTRDVSFFYFGGMVLSCLLNDVALLQYGHAYLWPDAADWNLRSPGVLGVPSLVLGSWLFMRLLPLLGYQPRWTGLIRAAVMAVLLTIPGMLFLDYVTWVRLMHLVSVALLGFLALQTLHACWLRMREAWLVLLAFVSIWFVALMRMAQILGWLPYDFAIDYSQNWALLLTGMLIVGMVMNKMRHLRKAQERAEREALVIGIETRLQAEYEHALKTRDLQMAKDVAEEANAAKSRFLAQLSHELRTPLHSILGYSGLIHDDSTSEVDRRRIAIVQRSGRHLLGLIDELLDYARSEIGRLKLDLQPVHLYELLESVVDEVRPMAEAQGMRVGLEASGPFQRAVFADGSRLRQVLSNLMNNAYRHGQGSNITLIANTRLEGRHVQLALAVCDDGRGIPVGDRERIFLPFERGSGPVSGQDRESLGLGLAITTQLVQLMGGQLEYEPGSPGSCFRFALQLEMADMPDSGVLQGNNRDEWHYSGQQRCIMVVDDIIDNCEPLADLLQALGFRVVVAESGHEALLQLASDEIDLVITDQRMSGMSGWELLHEVRLRNHGMPFVLLSASPPQPPDGWPDDLVFDAMLMKPVEMTQLLASLTPLLGLVWEPVGERQGGQGPACHLPGEDMLQRLRNALAEGRISDMEDWVDEVQEREPGARAMAAAVREALRRMDLPAIQRLLEQTGKS